MKKLKAKIKLYLKIKWDNFRQHFKWMPNED